MNLHRVFAAVAIIVAIQASIPAVAHGGDRGDREFSRWDKEGERRYDGNVRSRSPQTGYPDYNDDDRPRDSEEWRTEQDEQSRDRHDDRRELVREREKARIESSRERQKEETERARERNKIRLEHEKELLKAARERQKEDAKLAREREKEQREF